MSQAATIRRIGELIRQTPKSKLQRKQLAAAASTYSSIVKDDRVVQVRQIECNNEYGKPISGDILAILTRKKALK